MIATFGFLQVKFRNSCAGSSTNLGSFVSSVLCSAGMLHVLLLLLYPLLHVTGYSNSSPNIICFETMNVLPVCGTWMRYHSIFKDPTKWLY